MKSLNLPMCFRSFPLESHVRPFCPRPLVPYGLTPLARFAAPQIKGVMWKQWSLEPTGREAALHAGSLTRLLSAACEALPRRLGRGGCRGGGSAMRLAPRWLPQAPLPPAALAARRVLRPGRCGGGSADRSGPPEAGERTAFELRCGAQLHQHMPGSSSDFHSPSHDLFTFTLPLLDDYWLDLSAPPGRGVPWRLAGTHLFDSRTGDLQMDFADTLEDCCARMRRSG